MLHDFLGGIRVLDLSQYLPGPFAGQLLADLGADVLKVEPPGGEPMRGLDPVWGNQGPSPYYDVINAGKSVVEIDLKSDEGRAAFETLVEAADVLLESYRPEVLERLGFGDERLAELNPRLVHCALSGYGQTGPLRLAAGHDINYVAMTGALSVTGTREKPVMAYPPIADCASAIQAALAVAGALVARERTGKGATIDVSLAETILAWQAFALTGAQLGGRALPLAGGMINGGAAYYGIYRTADGRYISLGAIEDKFWANFCEAVGRPEWTARQTEPFPQDDLIAEVADHISTRPLAEWDALLGTVDCCYHAVLDYTEVTDAPHVRARGLVKRHDTDAPHTEVLFPAWVDGQPPRDRAPVRHIDAAAAVAAWIKDDAGRAAG